MKNNVYRQIVRAVQLLRQRILWKPGSAERHLLKRRRRKHLPDTATQDDYDMLIRRIINNELSEVRILWHENIPYAAIDGIIDSHLWLVIFDMSGVMETAFIVDHPERYLNSPTYEYIGRLREVLDNEIR